MRLERMMNTSLRKIWEEGAAMEKHLNDLEMAKKRDHKIMITDEAIGKVPRIQYKDIPENEYDNIQDLAKNVLKISKDENDSNEVAVTYALESISYIHSKEDYIGVAIGGEHGVDPLNSTVAYHLIKGKGNCVVIVLHNHPSLSDFSLTDIEFLIQYDKIKLMVVVTNLGNITYLVKTDKYDYYKAVELINRAISMNNEAKNLKDLQNAADYFLKNCYTVGITYDNR
jgi:proteasome lid subunit RPN8/RPN11